MTSKRIRWIAVLMTVGLLGLIGFQLYWIRNALSLQREQFDYKVTDALQEVVRNLERQEILYMTRQRLNQQQQEKRLMAIARPSRQPARPNTVGKERRAPGTPRLEEASPDARLAERGRKPRAPKMPESGRMPVTDPAAPPMHQTQVSPSDALHSDFQKLSEVQQQFMLDIIRHQDALGPEELWNLQLRQQQYSDRLVDQVFQRQLQLMTGEAPPESTAIAQVVKPRLRKSRPLPPARRPSVPAEALKPKMKLAPDNLTKVSRQSEMVKEVFKDLLSANRPIESRVSRVVIDTLLHRAMRERGISIFFEYGVKASSGSAEGKPRLLFSSHSRWDASRVADNGKIYKAVLFPNNLLESGNVVYVYFPNQEAFILRKMTATLAGSAVMVLVIMTCFYVAISTILRQKKLADIKNDFINNMTHEFKTPISTISLAVEMAQEQLTTGESEPSRLKRYMGIIRDETKRLGTHVEKVLQIALLDGTGSGRGSVKLKLTPVNIHDAIGKVLNTIGLQIEQKGGEVHLDFGAEYEEVEADEVHLSNILYNLLDNAIKYSPEKPDITIRTRSLEEGVSIAIADKGIGMSRDQLGRIFEKFYCVPTGNLHDVKGFGLGLSYVKKIVEEHHGTVTVRSKPGAGSEFEVILPFKQ